MLQPAHLLAIPLLLLLSSPGTRPQEDLCSLEKNPGACKESLERFYYNRQTGNCQTFLYTGCKGNGNNFETLSTCQDQCKAARTNNSTLVNGNTSSSPLSNDVISSGSTISSSGTTNIGSGSTTTHSNGSTTTISSGSTTTISSGSNISSSESTTSSSISTTMNMFGGVIVDMDQVEKNTFKLEFESGPPFVEWYESELQLVVANGSENHVAAPPAGGRVAAFWREIQIMGGSQLEIYFSLYVVFHLAGNSSGPTFKIRLTDSNRPEETVVILTLEGISDQLRQATWQNLRYSAPLSPTDRNVTCRFEMSRGNSSQILLDDIQIRIIPLMGETSDGSFIFQDPTTTTTTTTAGTTATSSLSTPVSSTNETATTTAPINNASTTGKNNTATTTHTTASFNKTTSFSTIDGFNATTTVTPGRLNTTATVYPNPNTSSSTVNSSASTTITTSNSSTTIKSTSTTTKGDGTNSPLVKPENDSRYSQGVQILLIVLVVVFGLCVVLMLGKYYHLRRKIGDYRVATSTSRQTYDNPAFNGGFGMQEAYRSQ